MLSIERQRPISMVLLSVLAIISACVEMLTALALVLPSPAVGTDGETSIMMLRVGLSVWLFLMPMPQLVFGISVWRHRSWAWTLGICNAIASIGLALLCLSLFDSVGRYFVAIVLGELSLYYLFTPPVRSAFGRD